MWCITTITPEYRERMYRILDLYKEPYKKGFPVICFDEKSKQLLEDSRRPIPLKPGSVKKYDYEYKRNGTCNIFAAVEPKAGKHYIQVTNQRTRKYFALFMKWLIENEYRKAKLIRIVMDNLNTHFEKSFYETFSKQRMQRNYWKRIQFVYTPKHASWLNMAEIEINMMDKECLARNIGNRKELEQELGAWCNKNNQEQRKIYWRFNYNQTIACLGKLSIGRRSVHMATETQPYVLGLEFRGWLARLWGSASRCQRSAVLPHGGGCPRLTT